jgi:hypothetical protein
VRHSYQSQRGEPRQNGAVHGVRGQLMAADLPRGDTGAAQRVALPQASWPLAPSAAAAAATPAPSVGGRPGPAGSL